VLSVPEDGGEMAFSGTAEVQAAMQEGEAAFVKGDLDAAVAAYARALALDPHQYDAALFTGDVSFKKKDHEQADKWFARAVEIDPNRETEGLARLACGGRPSFYGCAPSLIHIRPQCRR
jgi:tetratricopeptide (TPR) repeat protein